MDQKEIAFATPKNYIFEKELGQGGCGLTILVYDPVINEKFVCKKYNPLFESMREDLFKNFINEIKLLYKLNHKNIVRVFNYYLYPDKYLGYIFMEYIDGSDIVDYLIWSPEDINNIFYQVIEGFANLEENKILHRDIRAGNILVNTIGEVKIIDFGFGKQTLSEDDFNKSISLNWWCELPVDFKKNIYDFTTEIYFIGKLFEKIITDYNIEQFKYNDLLKQMCSKIREKRIQAFSDIKRTILSGQYIDIDFSEWEKQKYQQFSDKIHQIVSKIELGAKFYDIELIQNKLEDCLKKVILEDVIPDSSIVIRSIVSGSYYYKKTMRFEVDILKNFVELLRSCNKSKKNIILSNLQTKLDTLQRYSEKEEFTDDIPF
jgi:serine/threonine-protein kinase